jgi:hypothetical protein
MVLIATVPMRAAVRTFTTMNNACIRTLEPASNYNGAALASFPGLNAPGGSPIGGMLMAGFDVAAYKGYEVVGDAILTWGVMWTQEPLTFGFACRPLLSNWIENTVTWDNYVGSDTTGTAYQLVVGPAMSSVTVLSNITYRWLVSNDVMQAWLDDPTLIHGLALVPMTGGGNSLFVARSANWWPDKIATLIVTVEVKQVSGPLTNRFKITNRVRMPNTPRLGLNIAGYAALDSPVTDEMLPEGNFEGLTFGSLHYANSNQCTATKWVAKDGAGLVNGQANGFTLEPLLGVATGQTATVLNYVASEKAFYLDRALPLPADGTPFAIRGMTNYLTGHWIMRQNYAVTPATRPGSLGEQCLRLDPSGQLVHDGDSVAWGNTYLIRLTGTWVMSAWARSDSGNAKIKLDFGRWGGPWVFSRTINLGTDWSFHSFTNTQESDPQTGAQMVIRVTHAGGSGAVYLDDWSIRRQSATDQSVYRPYVEEMLRDDLRIGSIRHFLPQTGGALETLFAPRDAQKHTDDRRWTSGSINFTVPETLQIAKTVGASSVWLVIPLVISTEEAQGLIEFLAGPTNTTYGAMRAYRGHPAPWTDELTVYFEIGNEVWDSNNEAVFADMCTRVFGAMRNAPYFDHQRMRCILGGQAGNTWRSGIAIPRGNYYDVYGIAPYTFGAYSDTGTDDTFGPLMGFTDWQYAGTIGAQLNQITANGRGKRLGIYEINMHTTGGAATQAVRNAVLLSSGAAVAGMDTLLQHLYRARMPIINVFSMRQYWYAFTTFLWGIYRDFEMTNYKRPYGHATMFVNRAIGDGALLETEQQDAAVWFQEQKNGVDGAFAFVKLYAVVEGNACRVVALNRDWRSNRLVNISLPFSAAGHVAYDRFRAPTGSPWDNCETNDNICWVNGSLPISGSNLVADLPPCSGTLFYLTNSAALHTVTAISDGLGRFDCEPSGMYPDGTELTLAAEPLDDAEFYGWSGAATGMAHSITMVVTNDMTLVAHFTPIPEPTFGVVLLALAIARRRQPPSSSPMCRATKAAHQATAVV